MADFSLQDLWWLKPKEPDNPLPAMQLGARMVQDRARHDLDKLAVANDIARTAIAHDESTAKLQLRTQIDAANAELSKAASQIRNWSDPAQMKPIYDLGSLYGFLVGTKGWEGIINTHERAVTAQRLGEEAQSRIDERNRRGQMAENVGWVYPEDGSPPYLVDAKGGTKFAPFHAGVEAGFTPEETMIGDTRLIHVSPNKWQVVERPIPTGKMTDLEKEDLRDIRKRRQAMVDALPSDAPRLGMFGGNKSAVAKYTTETNQIAELTAKEDALRQKVEGRGTTSPKAPEAQAASNDAKAEEVRNSFKAGKITKEQALQQLRELGFK